MTVRYADYIAIAFFVSSENSLVFNISNRILYDGRWSMDRRGMSSNRIIVI